MSLMEKILSRVDFYIMGGKRRLNIIKTVYINFRCLPFKQAVFFPIKCYGPVRFRQLAGKIVLSKVPKARLSIGADNLGYRTKGSTTITMVKGATMVVDGAVSINQGASILVDKDAILTMKNFSSLGDDSEIICRKSIIVGVSTRIAWQCQVTDFGSHFVMDCQTGKVNTLYRKVELGNYCWIGNRTTIQPGTRLPDRTIVASNSLLNKDYVALGLQSYSLIGGQPAKLLRQGVKRIYDKQKEAELKSWFANNNAPYIVIDNPQNQD